VQKLYIQDPQQLNEVCQQFSTSKILAIDTEFVRTRTYYPKLGLLQVCDGKLLALIDPVALKDLTPFWQLLSEPTICKVLHACSEDLEVFLKAQCKPVNIIDSQIMMSFLGHGLSMGYAAMVEHFTGVELDKSESRTDWLKRPLTDKQITYAQADVDYLIKIYPLIVELLSEKKLLENAIEESSKLVEKKFKAIDEELLYLNIKQSWRLTSSQLNRLKFLAKWRYNRAKERDLPLNFVVKEQTLIFMAQVDPKSVGAMANINDIDIYDVRHQGKAMLSVLKHATDKDQNEYPPAIVRLDQYPGYKGIYKKVKNFINDVAEKTGLSVEILASKKQINKFLSWHFNLNEAKEHQQEVDFLQGWRFELFGKTLQQLALAEF